MTGLTVCIDDRSGSVVTNLHLQIDGNVTDNPEGVAAAAMKKLLDTGSLIVNGTTQHVTSIDVNGTARKDMPDPHLPSALIVQQGPYPQTYRHGGLVVKASAS